MWVGLGVCQDWGEEDGALLIDELGMLEMGNRVHTVTPVYKVSINIYQRY